MIPFTWIRWWVAAMGTELQYDGWPCERVACSLRSAQEDPGPVLCGSQARSTSRTFCRFSLCLWHRAESESRRSALNLDVWLCCAVLASSRSSQGPSCGKENQMDPVLNPCMTAVQSLEMTSSRSSQGIALVTKRNHNSLGYQRDG